MLAIQLLDQVPLGFTAIIQWAETPRIHLGVEWGGLSGVSPNDFAHQFDAQLQIVSVEYRSKRQSQRLGLPTVSFWNSGVYERFRNWKVENGAPDAQVKDCIVATEDEWQCLSRLSKGL